MPSLLYIAFFLCWLSLANSFTLTTSSATYSKNNHGFTCTRPSQRGHGDGVTSLNSKKAVDSCDYDNGNGHENLIGRRGMFRIATIASIFTVSASTTATIMTANPSPANALQKRNEALCGTGFFEHFNEFRCTAIGDISDEGGAKKLNENESMAADSLMGKLGLSTSDIDMGETNKKDTDKQDRNSTMVEKKGAEAT